MTAPGPAPRVGAACATDEVGLYVFGGALAAAYGADTWYLVKNQWRRITSPSAPSARAHASAAFDTGRSALILFGGQETNASGKVLDDTWELGGGTWRLMVTSTRPPARDRAQMCFDARLRLTLLFGGRGAAGLLGDTWQYDGKDWTQLRPSPAPTPRRDHAMAFDKGRGEVLLFGGLGASLLQDTWMWDGTRWNRRTPRRSPPPLQGHTLTYDRQRDRYVLFGGFDGTRVVDATWEYDGTDWIERRPPVKPSARRGFLHRYVAVDSAIAGFGGESGQGTKLGDLWSYATTAPAEFTGFGNGCGGASPPFLLGSLPWTGETFTLSVVALPPASPAFLYLGLSDKVWNALPLPLDLGTIGAVGCRLYVQALALLPLANIGGRASMTVPVPNDPRLIGVRFFQQAWSLDPAANAAGLVVSNGGSARVGAK